MKSDKNVRELAVDALMAVNEDGVFLNTEISRILQETPSLSPEDRGLFVRLTEGTVQHRIRLDYFLNKVSKTPVRKMKPFIRALLRCAAYQILFLDRIPDHAVVNESVKMAKRRGFTGLSGFVNGVLRGLSSRKDEIALPDPARNRKDYLSIAFSVPMWLTELFLDEYGYERTREVFSCIQAEDKPLSLWANRLRTTPAELLKALESEGIAAEAVDGIDGAFVCRNLPGIRELASFKAGDFYVQNLGPMRVMDEVLGRLDLDGFDEESPLRVLDTCASPGGKSLYVANALGKRASIVSCDVSDGKLKRLNQNVERLGYGNIVSTQVSDALEYRPADEGEFDLVMLDVPCSGIGTMGRKPDIRYRLQKGDIASLAERQMEMVRVCSRYVNHGGYLLYMTCTVGGAENAANAARIASGLPFELICDRQLLPDESGSDGFYFALFKRKEADNG
ncbi:MAG: 16S rRNA (cytosine(967)-C(5))-methyltransferase RsmB [Eubacterium sp.]|nr:16S rRNA (cytosine(967)-C(5))-methyltransferase RsmB [Eubacterium sp.]